MDATEAEQTSEEMTKVDDLKPKLRSLNMKVTCVSLNEIREGVSRKTGEDYRVTEALIGDETGCVLMTVWNETINLMEEGAVYALSNVYTSIFHNSLRLNIGRYGEIEKLDDEPAQEVNELNNLSDEFYEQPRRRRRRPSYGGSRKKNYYRGRPDWKRSWANRKRKRHY